MHLLPSLLLVVVLLYASKTDASLHKRFVRYPPHVATLSGSYIVEFEDNDVHKHADNLNTLSSVSVHKRLTKAFNGAIVATSKLLDPGILASAPGVKRVWPNRKHKLSVRQGTRGDDLPLLHQKTGVAQAMQELGLDGTGVKVCIVDSGVDYNHPELGGCWKTEGCPWQLGRDFIGDKYDSVSDNPIIEPNETPTDCFGHGTHVAGIIAGRGPQVQGVAPGATLGMYRVFSCEFNGTLYTDDSIIMQGMEAAHEDGCDIINLSLGGGGGWVEDPTSVLSANIVKAGGIVVAAAGNDGDNGIQTVSAPAVGEGVIGVAAVENWNITAVTTLFSTPAGDRVALTSGPAENNVPFVFETATPLA
ncbi:hypothetical protein IWW36_003159, partial [Coemansia brasiliensis]